MPTYWSTPFSKICLGMRIGHQIKFIVINKQANSLYSLIADGHYRATSLGRNTWKTPISSQASLRTTVTKKGSMFSVLLVTIRRQESVSLVITEMTAAAVIPESGLVREGILMIPTRVGTRQRTQQIMETKKLKPWATSWCSES